VAAAAGQSKAAAVARPPKVLTTPACQRNTQGPVLLRLSDGAGLVTIYKDTRSAYLQFSRSVFERRAPRSLAALEAAIGEPVRQGNVVYEVSDELLAALTAAYEEAATGQLTT
jgi:hypothetical protein